ncbi:hypothetical protein GCM10007870_08310 [Gluconobacter kondonii]|uniref:Uncharacterized protein n=1 Tax=Gluconobacter kondonii TaxID=941463 RepID=A0ABQ5WNY8_9PROT|nr:hypothetical protein GCM10007870_08310 [Gluconobacter kondonii]
MLLNTTWFRDSAKRDVPLTDLTRFITGENIYGILQKATHYFTIWKTAIDQMYIPAALKRRYLFLVR